MCATTESECNVLCISRVIRKTVFLYKKSHNNNEKNKLIKKVSAGFKTCTTQIVVAVTVVMVARGMCGSFVYNL